MLSSSTVSPARHPAYEARRPERSILHEVVAAELEGFLVNSEKRGRTVPLFVERTFRDYLGCGDRAEGCVRVHCDDCGHDRTVAFSCKRRGFCPSCGGRRMADTAADLVDFVLPQAGIRQWVLTLPFALRYRLACDRTLVSPVLNAFVRAVFRSYRRRVNRQYGVPRTKCGAVTFVQRFGGALNLNVHFHTLVLEGAYKVSSIDGAVQFLPLRAPDDEEVRAVLADAAMGIARQLERRARTEERDGEGEQVVKREDSTMAALYAAAIQGQDSELVGDSARTSSGPARKSGRDGGVTVSSLCAVGHGVSLHAGVFVAATDRQRLERVCRYVARPPLAVSRISRTGDGRIRYRMRHAWRDGTSQIILEPHVLMTRLAAFVPPPRQHQVRYHGILAPNAAWRDAVVPNRKPGGGVHRPHTGSESPQASSRASRYRCWAELLRRVFAFDVLECPLCGGRSRVVGVVARPGRAPPIQPLRGSARSRGVIA